MRILGINKGATTHGKPLYDGGLALLTNGQIDPVLSEERLARTLRAGGYDRCLREFIATWQLNPAELDAIAVSTCCEPEAAASASHPLSAVSNLYTVDHHESHAWSAYGPSGFDAALVVVIDGGGNTLSDRLTSAWWEEPREQHSYYLATSTGLELIARDFDEPYSVGFGELYRAATKYLGWPTSRNAANVMALAAHGTPFRVSRERFLTFSGERIESPLRYDRADSTTIIARIGSHIRRYIAPPLLTSASELTCDHRDLAAYIQWNVDEALIERLRHLREKTGVRKLCLAGGYALNCVANGRIAEEKLFDNVYVAPAPGDHGQCIGNAVALYHRMTKKLPNPTTASMHACVGLPKSDRLSSEELAGAIRAVGSSSMLALEFAEPEEVVARMILAGHPVAFFRGRSETGLRALGNRSILARSDDSVAAAVVGSIKGREWFRPFAPAVLESDVSELFEIDVSSPFMSFATHVRERYRPVFAATMSGDQTARLQTVQPDTSLGCVLAAVKRQTGFGTCLNTSLNRRGEPLVETLSDAVSAFHDMELNAMAVGRFVLIKSVTPSLVESGIIGLAAPANVVVRLGDATVHPPADAPGAVGVLDWLQQVTSQVVVVRSEFALFADYLVVCYINSLI